MAPTVLVLNIDTRAARREIEKLRELIERSEPLRERVCALGDAGVDPFDIVPVPAKPRRGGFTHRAQLSDRYWDLLERAMEGGG